MSKQSKRKDGQRPSSVPMRLDFDPETAGTALDLRARNDALERMRDAIDGRKEVDREVKLPERPE